MVNLNPISVPDYKKMYEQKAQVCEEQWKFICMLIERLGGRVSFKDSDFRQDILRGPFLLDHEVDSAHDSRTYTVKRIPL